MRKALFFLGILNDADVEWMIATGAKQHLNPGEVLIQEGKATTSVFLVLEGVLSVVARAAGKQGSRTAAVRRDRGRDVIRGFATAIRHRPGDRTIVGSRHPRFELEARLSKDASFAARFYRAMAVFLSDRLRSTVSLLGYGSGQTPEDEASYADEIGTAVLDNVSLAGARFDLLQRRLRAV
jgi:CRP/FNR family transcriptional regulator, cyclic AMP receptor protein